MNAPEPADMATEDLKAELLFARDDRYEELCSELATRDDAGPVGDALRGFAPSDIP